MENLSAISSSPTRTPSRRESSHRSSSSASGRSPVSVQESRSPVSKGSAGSIDDDLVLPTLATLRQSRSIQDQVDSRIRELQAVDKEKGKFKSQRGGSETSWVKHEIAWTYKFVLSGNSKNRVTYDSLLLSQWISDFATIRHYSITSVLPHSNVICISPIPLKSM